MLSSSYGAAARFLSRPSATCRNGAVLVFSAHGVPPTVRQEAKDRSLKVIDATCPLVTKVHLEALKFAREKRTIILIGHKDHQEIVGTSGEAPDRTIVVDSVATPWTRSKSKIRKSFRSLRKPRLAFTTPRKSSRGYGRNSRRSKAPPATTSATPHKIAKKPSNR